MPTEFEESDEYIELQRHKDFRKKKHAPDCKCGCVVTITREVCEVA